MNNELFQEIFNYLQDCIDYSWSRLIFFAGYTNNSYSMKCFIDLGDGSYKNLLNLQGTNISRIMNQFVNIDKAISKERNQLVGMDKWTALTMSVDSDGRMKSEFDYTDFSENSVDYEMNWKKRYIDN